MVKTEKTTQCLWKYKSLCNALNVVSGIYQSLRKWWRWYSKALVLFFHQYLNWCQRRCLLIILSVGLSEISTLHSVDFIYAANGVSGIYQSLHNWRRYSKSNSSISINYSIVNSEGPLIIILSEGLSEISTLHSVD